MYKDIQKQALLEAKWYLERIRFQNPKTGKFTMVPCQRAAILTISVMIAFLDDLEENYDIFQLLLERCSQDYLEVIFSVVRGLGGGFNLHPTTLEFYQRTEQQLSTPFLQEPYFVGLCFSLLVPVTLVT